MIFVFVFFPLKVLSENWVVYHYFNLRAHRYEMSVTEIDQIFSACNPKTMLVK